jgi:hypothetical protein
MQVPQALTCPPSKRSGLGAACGMTSCVKGLTGRDRSQERALLMTMSYEDDLPVDQVRLYRLVQAGYAVCTPALSAGGCDAASPVPLAREACCLSGLPMQLHYFAVYDGHGGAEAAKHCANRMHLVLRDAIQKAIERQLRLVGHDDSSELDATVSLAAGANSSSPSAQPLPTDKWLQVRSA